MILSDTEGDKMTARTIMRIKRLNHDAGRLVGIAGYTNIPAEGARSFARAAFLWGEDALVVRCDGRLYDVTAEPGIYHERAV